MRSLNYVVGILFFKLTMNGTCAWTSTPSARTTHRISSDCLEFARQQLTVASLGPPSFTCPARTRRTGIFDTATSPTDVVENNQAEGNEEWEYVEYEMLKETDFLGSEWLVGTNWDSAPDKIDETWCRLAADRDGKNVAIWGDKSEGKWNFDVASQFLSFSKESLWGKQIWAGVVDDYYYCKGTVRGWTYVTPASVLAQWQAKRLGVDPEEAGTPPWFASDEEESI